MAKTAIRPETSPRAGWRSLFGHGVIAGLAFAAVGFVVGAWLGGVIGRDWAGVSGTEQNDPALVLGYVFAVVGWLWGLGFFRYPAHRLR